MHKATIFVLLIFVSFSLYADNGVPSLDEIMYFSVDDYLRRIGEQNSDAQELNSLGFDAYQDNNLLKAAKLWWCSISRDPNHIWANYNYACALALFAELYGEDPAELDYNFNWPDFTQTLLEYVGYIFEHLKKAISLDLDVWDRMQEDSDLDIIRNMMEYEWILFYPKNDRVALLNSVGTWHTKNIGVYSQGYVKIDGNRITIEDVDVNESYQVNTTLNTGYFTMNGNRLIITIESPRSETREGEITLKMDQYGFVTYLWLSIGGVDYYIEPDYGV